MYVPGGKYVLDGHEPVRVDDVIEWGEWYETHDPERSVGFDRIREIGDPDEVVVSTIFLGVDYNFLGAVPKLFETMIFGGPHDQKTYRYATWDEAAEGHARILELLKNGDPLP